MDIEAIGAIIDDLTGMAATILENERDELVQTKSKLDEYSQAVTAKLSGASKELAEEEFGRCQQCAREWISVYSDTEFSVDAKADILKEEVIEFFFTMDERIVSVQKNFFLLGMIDELLEPQYVLTKGLRDAKENKAKIRIIARDKGLTIKYRQRGESEAAVLARLWFFGDENNLLQSSEEGLRDSEAIDYLLGLGD